MTAPSSSPEGIIAIKMPKWGLSMDEGIMVAWLKSEGQRFSEGEELAEIETSKINNAYEAPTGGVLRRIVAEAGETVPVGGLLAVAAEAEISDAEIDAFVANFQAAFVPGEQAEESGPTAVPFQVEVDGRAIHGVSAGAGEPALVLVHGFSGNRDSWALNIGALAESRRVIAVDLPGHGESGKNVPDGSVKALAEAIGRALDALDVPAPHLVGHSLGGAVALHLAAARPGAFRSLTLVAPAGLPSSTVNRDFLDGIVDGLRPRDLRPWLELLFHDPALANAEMAEDMARYKRIDGVEEALSAIRDRLVGYSAFPAGQAPTGLPPVLVVSGESDRIVGPVASDQLPGDWRAEVLPGAGHMPHVEQASRFNALLQDFLAQNS